MTNPVNMALKRTSLENYLHKLLEKEGFDYHYINIYNRKTDVYLCRQYFDKFIIDKPLY